MGPQRFKSPAVERVFTCPWVLGLPGTTLSSNLNSTWPGNNLVTLSAWENPFSPIYILPSFYRDMPMKPASPQPFFFFFQHQDKWALSLLSTQYSSNKGCISQINNWHHKLTSEHQSPRITFCFHSPIHQPISWTKLKVQVAGKSQLSILNLCTSDLAHTTTLFMRTQQSWFIACMFHSSNLLLVHYTENTAATNYTVCQYTNLNKTMIYWQR